MTAENEERICYLLGELVGAFKSIARTLELNHQRAYPERKPPSDPTITYVPSEQEAIIEDQQGSEDDRKGTVEDWLQLGPRERQFVTDNPTEEEVLK